MSVVSQPLRVVYDTNVLLQALARPTGPAGACVEAVRAGQVLLYISNELVAELKDVAARPSVRQKLRLTEEVTSRFFVELYSVATLIDTVPAVYELVADPKDTMIVNLAIAAGARIITSRDKHLLALRDETTPQGVEFHSQHGSIEVLTPVELLERIRSS
jgi:putative PIN family toxin of toxin-antitoxin system